MDKGWVGLGWVGSRPRLIANPRSAPPSLRDPIGQPYAGVRSQGRGGGHTREMLLWRKMKSKTGAGKLDGNFMCTNLFVTSDPPCLRPPPPPEANNLT